MVSMIQDNMEAVASTSSLCRQHQEGGVISSSQNIENTEIENETYGIGVW